MFSIYPRLGVDEVNLRIRLALPGLHQSVSALVVDAILRAAGRGALIAGSELARGVVRLPERAAE